MSVKLHLSELDGMTELMKDQGDHFGELAEYASTTCRDTKGFDNLMTILIGPVHLIADWARGSLAMCQYKMEGDVGNLKGARKVYSDNEHEGEQRFQTLYPGAAHATWYPDFNGKLPDAVTTYRDQWKKPAEPDEGAGADLKPEIEARHRNLQVLNAVWEAIEPGDDLASRLTRPIIGDYKRFGWLSDAWKKLGDATYDVAANLRRGTLKIGGGWEGEAARAFEYHMFNWHMGVGGVGDTHHVIADALTKAGQQAVALAQQILAEVDKLIDRALKEIAAIFARYPNLKGAWEKCSVNWRMISAEDRARLMRALFLAYQIIHTIDGMIEKMASLYDTIGTKIAGLVGTVTKAVNDPGALVRGVRDTVDKKMNQAVTIEKVNGWNPYLGAWRMKMLPQ